MGSQKTGNFSPSAPLLISGFKKWMCGACLLFHWASVKPVLGFATGAAIRRAWLCRAALVFPKDLVVLHALRKQKMK